MFPPVTRAFWIGPWNCVPKWLLHCFYARLFKVSSVMSFLWYVGKLIVYLIVTWQNTRNFTWLFKASFLPGISPYPRSPKGHFNYPNCSWLGNQSLASSFKMTFCWIEMINILPCILMNAEQQSSSFSDRYEHYSRGGKETWVIAQRLFVVSGNRKVAVWTALTFRSNVKPCRMQGSQL